MSEGGLSARDFGVALKRFLEEAASGTAEGEGAGEFEPRLREHFGADPRQLPIVADHLDSTDHPNLQAALDEFVAAGGREHELLGVMSTQKRMMSPGLSELIAPVRPSLFSAAPPAVGPVDYVNVRLDEDESVSCVAYGLYLTSGEDGARLAMLVRTDEQMPHQRRLVFEVMGPTREAALGAIQELHTAMARRSVYRGRVLALSVVDDFGQSIQVRYHRLPAVPRDRIVLPAGVLDRIERHTVGFAERADVLRAARRHLKRGILLHGPPGTGKTLTAMYLARRMPGRTVLLLTGRTQGLVKRAGTMARQLAPALVVVEDVDLVAEDRGRPGQPSNPLLFELLDQMDGLDDDADVIFLLTTNRPQVLEPALASRPGRVDLAVELPLPDSACRRQLVELYGEGLVLTPAQVERIVSRADGASAAFIRELLREAALFAAEDGVLATQAGDQTAGDGAPLALVDRHIEDALRELTMQGGHLTRRLVGGVGGAGYV